MLNTGDKTEHEMTRYNDWYVSLALHTMLNNGEEPEHENETV